MCSASLILKHYGEEIILNLLKELNVIFGLKDKLAYDNFKFISKVKSRLYL